MDMKIKFFTGPLPEVEKDFNEWAKGGKYVAHLEQTVLDPFEQKILLTACYGDKEVGYSSKGRK